MDFEIRENRGPGGGRNMARERAAYFQLMEKGYSTREAARIVGINLRTGKRWRNGWHSPPGGRKAVPPIYQEPGQTPVGPSESEEPPGEPSRHLQEHDRIHIADRLREEASIRQIAAELGRSPSTISREIHRNRRIMANGGWYYRPNTAQARAEARRPRPKRGKIGQNPELRDFIQDHLELRWSPEQIAQALRARFPDQPEMHEPRLPPSGGRGGRWSDHRKAVNGILFRARTGIPWRDLPERYGSWRTVHERHRRWAADGTWDRILRAVQADADLAGCIDWTMAGVGSTSRRAHQHGAGARKAGPRIPEKGRCPGTTAPTRDSDGPGAA